MNMNEADQTNSLILKLKDNFIRFSLFRFSHTQRRAFIFIMKTYLNIWPLMYFDRFYISFEPSGLSMILRIIKTQTL